VLDRIYYLREQGIEDIHLERIFDPKLSPRNLCIFASKTNDKTKK
jgi:hypothetical protein